jgi:poly-gamma-glutamate synthesis protein (capsule biosynthesis protein)
MISVHSHQISGTKKEQPSKMLEDLAHFCIDAGANAVVGHGPHLLRPIEVYKDSPIFYSLGDFILQLYSVEFAPADFYQKHGVDKSATVKELLATRSKNFTVGLMTDKRMFLSVIPYWETEGKKLKKLTLLPILGKMEGNKSEIGLPRKVDPSEVIDYLGEMSAPYGVTLKAEADGTISCHW